MSGRENKPMTPKERLAREAVRELTRPQADPAFRERLKRDFVAGAIPERAEPVPRRSGRGPLRWSRFAPLAAAAVVLLAILAGNRGPAPRLLGTSGEGTVTVDGRAIPTVRWDELAAALRPGARIELRDGAVLDVHYPGSMVWRLEEGTIATLPGAPGRWFSRSVECALEIGEAAVRSGPDFPGTSLTIRTGEGMIVLTGTLVSVFRNYEVTCVCVQEGTASIGVDEEDLETVSAGKRKVMFRDGSPSTITEIAPPHRDHLIEFDAKYRGLDGS
ncbi:MAG: hypothetical protein ABIK65_01655 [Candidatus Eisenbacteria bacterium]